METGKCRGKSSTGTMIWEETCEIETSKQCSGFGSVCFWTSRMRIRNYMYGFGSGSEARVLKKLSLAGLAKLSRINDVNVPTKAKITKVKKIFFC